MLATLVGVLGIDASWTGIAGVSGSLAATISKIAFSQDMLRSNMGTFANVLSFGLSATGLTGIKGDLTAEIDQMSNDFNSDVSPQGTAAWTLNRMKYRSIGYTEDL